MKVLRSSFIVFICFCFVVLLLPKPSFAVGEVIDYNTAVQAGAIIVDLYGAANNTNLAYDLVNDGSALTVIQNLYTEYQASTGDPITLYAIGAAALAAGAFAVVYDAVTGKGYIQYTQTEYVSSLDGFWEYQYMNLKPGSLLRDENGNWIWNASNGNINPGTIYSNTIQGFYAQPNISGPSYIDNVVGLTNLGNGILGFNTPSTGFPYFYYYYGNGVPSGVTSGYNLVIASFSRMSSVTFYPGRNYNYIGTSSFGGRFIGDYLIYVASVPMYRQGYNSYWGTYEIKGAPKFDTLEDGLNAIIGGHFTEGDESILMEPTNFIGDPVSNPLDLTIPQGMPGTIITDYPYPEDLPSPVADPEPGVPYPLTDPSILNPLIPGIWGDIIDPGVGVEPYHPEQPEPTPEPEPEPEPEPDPPEPEPPTDSTVHTPLLPVILPNFDFNLRSIWYYVREWVASLGSWFTMTFQIWSALPYYMVVPVYATAVVVVVLGVFKRFFH